MPKTRKETVARALFTADYDAGLLPGDADQRPDDFREEYTTRATVAIDALADADGIAQALWEAEYRDSWTAAIQESRSWPTGVAASRLATIRHRAAAVVAWMKDRT